MESTLDYRSPKRRSRLPWAALALPLVLFSALLVPVAMADHSQRIYADSAAPTIIFNHLVGNEWWVEVKVTVSSSEYHVDRVEATDDGAAWHTLSFRSYGAWAGSFHIEPGHEVQFRAAQHGGMSDVWLKHSCWFTHPSGQPERCGTSGFDATFRDPSGNEWWQQVFVTANQGITRVDVSINGGGFQALALKSWGAWAASYHAPGGSIVQFRATSPGGATDLSGCYYWTLGTNADCDQGGSFDVSFRNVRGNKYWVEANAVVLRGDLAMVQYRYRTNQAVCPDFDPNTNSYTCPWVTMRRTDWGSFAANTNIPTDSVVGFRALSSANEESKSAEYRWPPQ